ncbi:hypothetical protein VTO73DRAFT_14204 [Trametes versicolor]
MRLFSILPVIAAAVFGTRSVVGRHSIYHDSIVDLDEVTATSYDLQALAFSLTAANFAVESPKIVSGLYDLVAIGAQFDNQAFDRKAMDAEQAQKVLAELTVFANAQRTLMGELIQKYPLASENHFTAQIAEGIRAVQSGTYEAGDGFTHIVPPSSVKAVKAQFHSINVAIQDALATYS